MVGTGKNEFWRGWGGREEKYTGFTVVQSILPASTKSFIYIISHPLQ